MTMSWFNTSGFATLAKSALSQAQKTIDKALDIKEDHVENVDNKSKSSISGMYKQLFFGTTLLTFIPYRVQILFTLIVLFYAL